ncbi:NUDIX domain-containing protein [Nocardia sp. NPDC050378]|uniref:NUDIX domain-containing protein n=1 Tax=Nocardia sp. NPDC050378 TaxID=3155400 RepID=UPI0033E46AC6
MTVGALLVRQHSEVLLVRPKAYGGILLQPGGHLDETDVTLIDAAVRELAEETGLDPSVVALESPNPVYIEYGPVPARPVKDEPAHFHLDVGYWFTTATADIGQIQVRGERCSLVSPRRSRAPRRAPDRGCTSRPTRALN